MNRRNFWPTAAAIVLQGPKPKGQDPYKLVMEYDLLVPGSYKTDPNSRPVVLPVFIAFTVHRDDSVLTLTEHILPVGFSTRFGSSLVIMVGFTNLGEYPGWIYFVNGKIVLKPARDSLIKVGDRVEWRLGKA